MSDKKAPPSILPKLCRDGLLYALVLYLFTGLRSSFDVTLWPVGLHWLLLVTWVVVMWCLASMYREERAQRERARRRGGFWPWA